MQLFVSITEGGDCGSKLAVNWNKLREPWVVKYPRRSDKISLQILVRLFCLIAGWFCQRS